jgi:acetyltransferase-like isoleucine patch superfamily enzyme
MKFFIKKSFRYLFLKIFPEFNTFLKFESDIFNIISIDEGNYLNDFVQLDKPYRIYYSSIGSYTYICVNSRISHTTIGKFCSIGPNFLCGWGIHPINGISTSPSFYSSKSYNNFSLSSTDKIEERKPIIIGNDVFIGANVTILDGVIISDGVIIAAGSVVNMNVPPFAIVGGVPAKILKFRFDADTITELTNLRWWDWSKERLQSVEENFYNVSEFIRLNK